MGNGQAAAGFSAVLAPGVAAVDGAVAGVLAIGSAGLAWGLAALLAFFFFPAFFFFLAGFFLPAAFLPAFFFNDFFFFRDAFFFFFFFPPFFAFFFAMLISFKVVEQKSPGVSVRSIQPPASTARRHAELG
ncbi:MAG TPA: hypothetical protein VD713_01590 [Sphingomonadales bacterium]|nr:hypothetical protein [Sphingomonadales bacterium]